MKKGFSLSVNALVIIILAFAFLAAGLIFIQKIFPKELPELPTQCDIYPPTDISPICISDNIAVKRGKEYALSIAVYNNEDDDILSSVSPQLSCSANVDGDPLNVQFSSTTATIGVTEVGEYKVVIKVPKETEVGMYPCTIKVSNIESTFMITVE